MFRRRRLASTVPDALPRGQNAFVVAYVSVRLILLALYVRVYRDLEVARPVAGWFILMFGLAVCDWLISLAVPVPWKYVFGRWPSRSSTLRRSGRGGCCADARRPEAHPGALRPADHHRPRRVRHRVVLGTSHVRVDAAVGHGRPSQASSRPRAIWWLYFDFLDAAPW
jgi:hypothetical protein